MKNENRQAVNEVTKNTAFYAKILAAREQQEDFALNMIAEARKGQQVIKVKLDEI